MRVVSLLPAATEIVAAIGGAGMLVGVSHECDYPPAVRDLPRVTRSRVDIDVPAREIDRRMAEAKRTGISPIEVDFTTLARLRPDVLIGQSVCDVCAVGEGELARVVPDLHPTPWVVTLHPHSLDDVLSDVLQLGETLALQEEAQELVAGLRHRIRRLASQPPPAPRPRVLVLEWLEPPYVAGHWVPELVALAGGEDVGNTPSAPSVARSWKDLAQCAPDVVVIALCGFDEERARREHAGVSDPDARAVLSLRQEFIDGNAYTSRPGPRLVDAAEHLSRLFHR